jgi:ribosomal protein S18 acetylase RimI-like enzyme
MMPAQPVRNAAPLALLEAIEANRLAYDAWRTSHIFSLPGTDLHDDAEITWAVSGLPYALANGVSRTHWPADLSRRGVIGRIEAVANVFAAQGLPFSWVIGPLTRPACLGTRLAAWGMVLAEVMPWMSLDLGAPLRAAPSVPLLDIGLVQDDESFHLWVQTLVDSYNEAAPDDLRTVMAASWLQVHLHPPIQAFLGRLGGEAVATALLFPVPTAGDLGGVVGMYDVSTLPRMRRRGIGRAMTAAALRGAQQLGYTTAVLGATSMGLSLYRGLGFRRRATYRTYVKLVSDDAPLGVWA